MTVKNTAGASRRLWIASALALAAWRYPDENGDPLGVRDLFIDRAAFDAWRARYAARLREDGQDDDVRASAMRAVNPAYVLRNHLAEQAIQAAQQGDYQPIERLRAALADPYREHPANAELAALPPDWAQTLSVSCSS